MPGLIPLRVCLQCLRGYSFLLPLDLRANIYSKNFPWLRRFVAGEACNLNNDSRLQAPRTHNAFGIYSRPRPLSDSVPQVRLCHRCRESSESEFLYVAPIVLVRSDATVLYRHLAA